MSRLSHFPDGLIRLIEQRQREGSTHPHPDWHIYEDMENCWCPICGGFTFESTPEGVQFWRTVLDDADPTPYFERYENKSMLNGQRWD